MNKDEYIQQLKSEIREVALNLINDDIHFIEGIRIIRDKLNYISLSDDEANLIRGIDSDTDDVPVGETRKLWNKEALEKLDRELEEYILEVKPAVKDLCKRILQILD